MKSTLISLLFLILLSGCGLETKTLEEFYKDDLQEISKIIIVDGNTGEQKNVTDQDEIDSFINEIKEIKFIPEENQEDRDGFNYSISLFEDNKKTFEFGPTLVNENYYYTEPDIHPIVNEFYKGVKGKYE